MTHLTSERAGHLSCVPALCDLLKTPVKTQGEIEASICAEISRLQQDYMGRGPKDIRAHLFGDLLVVRLRAC